MAAMMTTTLPGLQALGTDMYASTVPAVSLQA
jgi:hypothetical protein